MIVGYARISTESQDLSLQISQLEKEGCEKIFTDISSGGNINREGLGSMMNFVREGDTVICTKTDRIARDTIHALSIADKLKEMDVGFKLLDLGDIDLNSVMGRAIYTIVSALAQAERERIKERTEAGRAKAKAEGKHMGRPSQHDADQVKKLLAKGMGATEVARTLGMGRASVYRLAKGG